MTTEFRYILLFIAAANAILCVLAIDTNPAISGVTGFFCAVALGGWFEASNNYRLNKLKDEWIQVQFETIKEYEECLIEVMQLREDRIEQDDSDWWKQG